MRNGREKKYRPRQWFLKLVGGETASIPAQVGTSLIVRIYHREMTEATGAKPQMRGDLREIVSKVDKLFGYREVLGRMLPPKRRGGNDEATPAGQFFDKIAFGESAMQEYAQKVCSGVESIIPDAPRATIAKRVAAVGKEQAASLVVRKIGEIFQ